MECLFSLNEFESIVMNLNGNMTAPSPIQPEIPAPVEARVDLSARRHSSQLFIILPTSTQSPELACVKVAGVAF